MEYGAYVQWCEQNRLPAMDYTQWESGHFMQGMVERRDQGERTRADADAEWNQKGVEIKCGPKY